MEPRNQGLPIKAIWDAYLKKLETEPVATKALTAGVLSIVSDVLAQRLSGQKLDVVSLRDQLLIGCQCY